MSIPKRPLHFSEADWHNHLGASMNEQKEIECAMRERRTVEGTPILGHIFRDTEEHDNCHVTVSVCENCGKVEIGWYRMDHPPIRIAPPQIAP